MISANELRIGNKVLFDSEIDTVSKIYKEGVDGEFKSRWASGRLHGIPLTPSILEACGFKKEWLSDDNHDEGHYYSLRLSKELHCPLSLISGDKNGYMDVCMFPYEYNFMFRYLHQLQNIHYAITNTELTIDTTKL